MKNIIVMLVVALVLLGCKTKEDRIKEFAFAEINSFLIAPETSEFTGVKIYEELKDVYVVCGYHSSMNRMGVRGLTERFAVSLDTKDDHYELFTSALDSRSGNGISVVVDKDGVKNTHTNTRDDAKDMCDFAITRAKEASDKTKK